MARKIEEGNTVLAVVYLEGMIGAYEATLEIIRTFEDSHTRSMYNQEFKRSIMTVARMLWSVGSINEVVYREYERRFG